MRQAAGSASGRASQPAFGPASGPTRSAESHVARSAAPNACGRSPGRTRRAAGWIRAALLAAALAVLPAPAGAAEPAELAVIQADDVVDFPVLEGLQRRSPTSVFDLRDQLLVQERERALRKGIRALRRGDALRAQLQFDRAVRAEERRRDFIALPNPGPLGVIVPLTVRRPVVVIRRRCCD